MPQQTQAQKDASYAAAGVPNTPVPYTTKQNGNLYEVYQGANRVGTGTKDFADSYLTKNAATSTASNNGTGTPAYTPYVSDSSSVVAGENNTMNGLSSLFSQTPDIKNLMENSKNSIAEISSYQAALEERRKQQEESIMKDYAGQATQLQDSQNRETGSTDVALTTKLGGYLGSSGSAVGAMNNLAATHRTEMLALDSKRDAAIQAARNAIEDKDFALARMKSDEIKSVTADIYNRQQDFFNNALKLSANNRAEDAATGDKIKNTLDVLSKAAISDENVQMDPKQAAEIDSYYHVPGFTQNYLQAARSAAVAKTQQDKIETMQKYVDLIESVPQGTKIPIGGEMVTGIGKVGDIASYQIEDKSGNVRIVNFNKGSGQYSVTNVGQIGKPSADGGLTDEQKSGAVSGVMQALSQGKDNKGTPVMDPATGKISASAFLQAVNAMQAKYPGSANYIYSKFLDPSLGDETRYFDAADLQYLRQKAGVGVGYGAVPAQ